MGGEGLTTVEIDHGESRQTTTRSNPSWNGCRASTSLFWRKKWLAVGVRRGEQPVRPRLPRATKNLPQPGFTITDSGARKAARGLPLFSRDELARDRDRWLTPQGPDASGRKKLRIDTAQRLVMILDSLPSVNEFAAVAGLVRAAATGIQLRGRDRAYLRR